MWACTQRDGKMNAERHLDEGRDVKQFCLLLPNSGFAELARLHGKYVGVDVSKRVANLIDDQGEFAVDAMAEVNRQRIEGETEQAGITQQPHVTAGQIDTVLGRAAMRISAQGRSIPRAV